MDNTPMANTARRSGDPQEMFIERWLRNLAESASSLDFRDAEDRAAFRGNVHHSMRHLKWEGMRKIASHLGAEKIPRNRDATARMIAALYMQRYAPSVKKSAAQLNAEINTVLMEKSP